MSLPKVLATAVLAAGLVTGMTGAAVHFDSTSTVASAAMAPAGAGAGRTIDLTAVDRAIGASEATLAALRWDVLAAANQVAITKVHETASANAAEARAALEARAQADARAAARAEARAEAAKAEAAERAENARAAQAAATEARPVVATPAPAVRVTSSESSGDGCAAALSYLEQHAAPGFTFECPAYAEGNEAMTCVNTAGVCSGESVIAINDPCKAAYMNEASNSWVAEGKSDAAIDPYGSCG